MDVWTHDTSLGDLKLHGNVADGADCAQAVAGINHGNVYSVVAIQDTEFWFKLFLQSINRPKNHLKSTTGLAASYKQ